MKQYSDKDTVNVLVDLCLQAGIREVVLSPGSRNAPLVFSFDAQPDIVCYNVVDERSAAFFALGMAQQLHRPVGLVCTSGTAVLNYAPAVAEAYYQRMPLVLITADRPQEWIDQNDGQTIRQHNVYANYIRYSCTLPVSIATEQEGQLLVHLVSEALHCCTAALQGPVHINVPLAEPLYGRADGLTKSYQLISKAQTSFGIDEEKIAMLAEECNRAQHVIILLGAHKPDEALNRILLHLAERYKLVVLAEANSNMYGVPIFRSIDKLLASIDADREMDFVPDLLITFDGLVTSKNAKTFLRRNRPKLHWHISQHDAPAPDTYRCLSSDLKASPSAFFEEILPALRPKNAAFFEKWQQQQIIADARHERFVHELPWSDLKVFSILAQSLPADSCVQVSNSTAIRYVQLFDTYKGNRFYANRGTSGIDGCSSTAVGASVALQEPVLLITGDLSFFYDSNALWNCYLRSDFKIIVINNGGGGIFRYIAGDMSEREMRQHFEAQQQEPSCELLARSFGLDYSLCKNEEDLALKLPLFLAKNEKASILEIKTPNEQNAVVLKAYFERLKMED